MSKDGRQKMEVCWEIVNMLEDGRQRTEAHWNIAVKNTFDLKYN